MCLVCAPGQTLNDENECENIEDSAEGIENCVLKAKMDVFYVIKDTFRMSSLVTVMNSMMSYSK